MVSYEIKKVDPMQVKLMRQFLAYEDPLQHLVYGEFELSDYDQYDSVDYYLIKDKTLNRDIGMTIVTSENDNTGKFKFFTIQEFLIMPAYRNIGLGSAVVNDIMGKYCSGYWYACPLDTTAAKNFWLKISSKYINAQHDHGVISWYNPKVKE